MAAVNQHLRSNHADCSENSEAPRRYLRIFPLFGGLDTIFEKEKQLKHERKIDKNVSLKKSSSPIIVVSITENQ